MADQIITMAEYRATLNGQPFDQGAASMQQSAAGVATSLDKVSESSNRVTAATAVSTSGFERLLASLDKNVAMADAYQAKLDQLNRLHDAGQISAGQYSAALSSLNEKYGALTGANDNATGALSKFTGALGVGREVLGAFGVALSVGGLVEFGKGIIESVAGLDNQAKALGISTEQLQAFHAAAVLSGAGADAGDQAIRRFTVSLGMAQQGATLQTDALKQLGITGEDLYADSGMLMSRAATALLDISNKAQQARIETELFGRAGQDVNAMLGKWADPDIVNHMRDMGLVINDELVQRAADADKAWNLFWLHFKTNSAEWLLGGGPAAPPPGTLVQGGADYFVNPPDLGTMLPVSPSATDLAGISADAAAQHAAAGRAGIPFAPGYPYQPLGTSSVNVTASPLAQDPASAVADLIAKQQLLLELAKETADQRAIDTALISAAAAQLKDMGDNGNTVLSSMKQVRDVLGEQTASLVASNAQATELDQKYQKLIEDAPKAFAADVNRGLDGQIKDLSYVNFYGVSQQTEEASKKAAAEMQRQQEEAAKASDEYWNRMFDNSFRSGQTFFTNLFAHGKASLSGFLTDFEQMFGTMLSDLALKAIAKPILMPVMEGFAGSLGLGPSMAGAAGIGGLFGSSDPMAASYGAYGSVGTFLNQPLYGVGGLFGGAGAASSLSLSSILGPLAIVGTLAASLFSGKPSNYTAYANFGSDLSLTGGLTGDKPNSTTLGLAGQLGQSVSAAAKSLEAAGVNFSNTIKQIQIGSRDQSRLITGSGATLNIGAAGDVSAATAGALSYLLGGASSSDASVQAVIDKYREAGKLTADNANAMISEIQAVKQKASDLDSFVKSTSDNILKFTNPVLEGWTALMNVEDARLKQAQTLGADVSNLQTLNFHEQLGYLNQLNDTQRAALGNLIGLAGTLAMTVANTQSAALTAVTQQLTLSQQFASQMRSAASQYGGAATSLGNAGNALLVGNLSPLSPADQYSAARSSLEQTFATASHGDVTALNGLSGAANTFLQQSLAFNGATAQYSRDFQYVQSLLAQGQKVASASADAAAKLADLADQQVSLLQEISTELKGPSPDRDLLQKQVDALNKIQDSANQTVLRLNDQLAAIAGQSSDIAAAYYSASAQAAAKITGTVDESGKQVQTGLGQVNDAVQKSADDIATSVTLGSDLTVGAVFQSSIGTQLQSALNIDGVTSALDKFISALDDAAAHIAGTPLTPSAPVSTVTTPAGVPVDQAFAAAVQASINNDFSLILRTTQRPSNRDAVSATNSAIQNDLLAAFAGGSISTPSQQASLADAIQRMGDTIASSNGSLAQSITDLRAEQAALRRLLTTAA